MHRLGKNDFVEEARQNMQLRACASCQSIVRSFRTNMRYSGLTPPTMSIHKETGEHSVSRNDTDTDSDPDSDRSRKRALITAWTRIAACFRFALARSISEVTLTA